MHTPLLSASVMCISPWNAPETALRQLEKAGVELLHADVMDGRFVPNLMLGTDNIRSLRSASPLPLDLHLMVEAPEEKLGWFQIQPGEYVSVHAESTRHLQKALSQIREAGGHPSVALNPATPLCAVEDVLEDVDMILLMTVNPGFAGQKLIPQTLGKITRLRELLDKAGKSHVRIEVDGNVSFENAEKMRRAGADVFVLGTSSIFHKDATVACNALRVREALTRGEQA